MKKLFKISLNNMYANRFAKKLSFAKRLAYILFSCINAIKIFGYNTFDTYYNIDKRYLEDILNVVPSNAIPFFDSININLNSSFILYAVRGTGKSTIVERKIKPEIKKWDRVLIVKPFFQELDFSSKLETFIKNKKKLWFTLNSFRSDEQIIALTWKADNLRNFIISKISQEIIKNFYKLNLINLDNNEKFNFFIITCLYHFDENILHLERLLKLLEPPLFVPKFKHINKIENKTRDSNCFKAFKKMSDKINIIDDSFDGRLMFICLAMEKLNPLDNFLNPALCDLIPQKILKIYLNLIKKVGFNLTILIDGLDEISKFNISPSNCFNAAFGTVIRSLKSLFKIKNQFFKIFLFLPDCKNINIQDFLTIFDKFR